MNFLRYYIYYIFLHLTLVGSSLIQVGDAISVSVDSSATYKYLSNILKTETNELSDDTYTLTPGAIVNFGKPGTALDLELKSYYDILKYQDYSDLDINLFRIYLNGSYRPSDLTSSSFSYSNEDGQIARSESSTGGSPALIETSRESASFFANYRYSPKLSFSLGANFLELTYLTEADKLSAKRSITIPFNLSYHYSNKLSVQYGVSFTDTEVGARTAYSQPAYDTNSVYYNVGLNGTILPKLTGQFNVGYRTLSFSTATDDINALGVTSNLTWTLTPKLRTTVNFSKDFDVAGSGNTHQFTRLNLSTVYSISTDYKLSLNFGHTAKNFRANPLIFGGNSYREERLRDLSVNLHYIPSENYSFTAGYHIYKSKADLLDNYDLNVFRLTAKLKY